MKDTYIKEESNKPILDHIKIKEPSAWDYFYRTIRYKYATFVGRASRAEFLSFYLFNHVFNMGINTVFSGFMKDDSTVYIYVWLVLACLYNIFTFVPNVAITVRRLHDSNKSGLYLLWIYFLYCLPILYGLIYSIEKNTDFTEGLFFVCLKFFAFFESIFGLSVNYPEHIEIMTLFVAIVLISNSYVMYLLLRKTQPDDNQYGPSLLK